MRLDTLIGECSKYDIKSMLEQKKPKSWLKSMNVFANGLGASLFFHEGDMSEMKPSERQQKIQNLIRESPSISGRQMFETLLISQRSTELDLSTLKKLSILKDERKDNDGMWTIIMMDSSNNK